MSSTPSSTNAPESRSGGEWLQSWDPENAETWDSGLAWKTLWISTLTLMLGFVAWYLPSAVIPKLNALGYSFTKNQLYWMAAMPGLSAGLFRLVWMTLPPIIGTRKMVAASTLLFIAPTLGWGVRVLSPTAPYWELMVLAFLAGLGGGAFSGFMPSTSYFFPKRMSGTALGLQAGISNLGVSLVQLVVPILVGLGWLGFIGGSQQMKVTGKPPREVWYQNGAFFWIPLMIVGAIVAWMALKSVPIKANIRQQFDIFGNVDTWLMTLLYIMTFGTFSGLAAQFGLLTNSLYGADNPAIVSGTGAAAQVLVAGYTVPDPVKFVFWGPLVGAVTRFVFAPLTDKFGGAKWTLVSAIGLIASIAFTMTALTPDTSSAAALESGFQKFFWGMMLIFFTSGIGNASTFKQMPMIFEKRQAGGVIGWTAAIAAFGPFLFGIGLNTMGAMAFYGVGVAFAVMCAVITWVRYARKGAPKPS